MLESIDRWTTGILYYDESLTPPVWGTTPIGVVPSLASSQVIATTPSTTGKIPGTASFASAMKRFVCPSQMFVLNGAVGTGKPSGIRGLPQSFCEASFLYCFTS